MIAILLLQCSAMMPQYGNNVAFIKMIILCLVVHKRLLVHTKTRWLHFRSSSFSADKNWQIISPSFTTIDGNNAIIKQSLRVGGSWKCLVSRTKLFKRPAWCWKGFLSWKLIFFPFLHYCIIFSGRQKDFSAKTLSFLKYQKCLF